LVQGINIFSKLIQERQAIRANTSLIENLSQDLVNLANLQENSPDITPYQVNMVNEKRINLRNTIVNLKEGLQLHYGLGEEALQPLVSIVLLQTLVIKHREILRKLSEVDMVILNLSPLGMLFNSCYIKETISAIFVVLQDLSCQESSILLFSGICRDEEPC
jgi:hypothetical protein